MRLLLDENVSPRIVGALRDAGHDVGHVRDLDMVGAADHVVWRRAVAESRVLVTINARDFVKLAQRAEIHGGLITFASGLAPDGQLSAIGLAVARIEAEGEVNRWVSVGIDGSIESRELPPL